VSSELRDSTKIAPRNLNLITPKISGVLLIPKGLSPSQKVSWLYEQLMDIRPDTIILHVNPNDVFSICAALALRHSLGSRVLYFNHADHVFNIGMSCVDYVIDFRIDGARYTFRYRGVEPKRILLVPLTSASRKSPSISRAELGIPNKCTASITIASYYKLQPDSHWDFGKAIYELLSSEPNHYHLMVGYGSESVKKSILGRLTKSPPSLRRRLIWLGRRTDIDSLLRVADFIIESFPLAGGIVRLEAMSAGLPIIAIENVKWPLHSASNFLGNDYPLIASNNEEVVHLSRRLISDNLLRLECAKRLTIIYDANFSESVVLRALKNVLSTNPQSISSSTLALNPEYDLRYAVTLGGRVPSFSNISIQMEKQTQYAPHLSVYEELIRQPHRAKELFKRTIRALIPIAGPSGTHR
jgi:glycosyltransferase involved in cell wall biosynthesis